MTGFAVFFAAAYVGAFYLEGFDFPTAVSFDPQDAPFVREDLWQDQSVGVHFFGDYLLPWQQSNRPSPYSPGTDASVSSYLPFAHILVRPFTWLPYHVSLFVFLLASLVVLFAPALYALRNRPVADRVLLAVAGVVLTYPMLSTLDRGNLQGFISALVIVAVLLVERRRYWLSAVLIGLAAAAKGYPLVFVLLLVRQRKWSAAAVAVGVFVVTVTIPLAAWRGGFIQNTAWLIAATGEARGGAGEDRLVSSSQSLAGLFSAVEQGDLGALSALAKAAGDHYSVVATMIGLALVALVLLGRRVTTLEATILLACSVTLLPPLVGGYTLTLFFAPILLIFQRGRGSDLAGLAYAILLGLLMAPRRASRSGRMGRPCRPT